MKSNRKADNEFTVLKMREALFHVLARLGSPGFNEVQGALDSGVGGFRSFVADANDDQIRAIGLLAGIAGRELQNEVLE